MSIGFSVTPFPGSGLGAQLQQFAFLYALGRGFGWEYIHVPWDTRRLGRSIYDLIGFDQALGSRSDVGVDGRGVKRIDVVDSTFLDPAGGLISASNLAHDFGMNDQGMIVNLKFTTWQRCNLTRKIVAQDLSRFLKMLLADLPDFKRITGAKINGLHQDAQTGKDFVVVAHLRRGDTAVVKVGDRLLSCWQLSIDANGNHNVSVKDIAQESDAFYPPVKGSTYLEVLRTCIAAIRRSKPDVNLKVIIVSDGYEQSRTRLLGSAAKLNLSPELIDEAIASANTEFADFEDLPAFEILIGEDEERLRKAIYWISRSDLLITGTGSFGETVKGYFSSGDDYLEIKLKAKGAPKIDVVLKDLESLVARRTV